MEYESLAEVGIAFEIVQVLEGHIECANCDRRIKAEDKAAHLATDFLFFCRPCLRALLRCEEWRPD